MRKEIVAQRKIFDQAIHQLVTLLQPEKKLKKMDKIIDANPDILKTVHENLTSRKKGSTMASHCAGFHAITLSRYRIIRPFKKQ